jgi:hypothetical protein
LHRGKLPISRLNSHPDQETLAPAAASILRVRAILLKIGSGR